MYKLYFLIFIILVFQESVSYIFQVLKNYPDQEIIEVFLPKLAQEVSTWDFFVAKFANELDGLGIFEMLKEFEKFISQLKMESHKCLSPVNLQNAEGKTIINVSICSKDEIQLFYPKLKINVIVFKTPMITSKIVKKSNYGVAKQNLFNAK